MNRFFSCAVVFAMFAAPAFAGMKPQTVIVGQNISVGTTPLPAGDYKLTYTGSGSNVQVTLMQGKKTAATFTAKEVAVKNIRGVETASHDGVVSLVAIQLKDVRLELVDAPQAGQ